MERAAIMGTPFRLAFLAVLAVTAGGAQATAPGGSPPPAAVTAPADPMPVPVPQLRPRTLPAAAGTPAGETATGPAPAESPVAAAPPPPLPRPSAEPEEPLEGTTACALALAAFGVKAEAAPGLGEGECRVTAPVTMGGAGEILMMPKALVECVTAAAVAAWLSDTVAPRADEIFGVRLTAVRLLGSYDCRPTNRVAAASLSEHARGRAIDIGGFRIGERWITIGSANPSEKDQAFLLAVRASACGPFKTVLGPGSDAEHQDHFHLDTKPRRGSGAGRGLFCQ
jgi:hypothetical protein